MAATEKHPVVMAPDYAPLETSSAGSASVDSPRSSLDLLSAEYTDRSLGQKMKLVNDAISEIGMTSFQWRLFCLAGFGYFANNSLLLVQGVIALNAQAEFHPRFNNALTLASYTGMLVGGLFWGLTADIIGRRIAFNVSLFICSIFAIVAGGSPNWVALASFVALSGFGAGGNLALDTTVFLEYLPGNKQWLLTLMAVWWGAGQLVAGLFAWAFLPNYSCAADADPCLRRDNMGWRYVWFAMGSLVFVLSLLRVTLVRLGETPKFLLGEGRDAEVIAFLTGLANKHNRPCSLTLEKLQACGDINQRGSASHAKNKFSLAEVLVHVKGLFATKRIGLSFSLLWLSWVMLGLAFPLYFLFLPAYLSTRGELFGDGSAYTTFRNNALVNFCATFGPIPATLLCETRLLGRRYTMVIGALLTMAFFFAYSRVDSAAQNLGFSCAITFCFQWYLSVLYAYTPEVLPSAHRGTGSGILNCSNSIMGALSAIVAAKANTETPVPIWICGGLFLGVAVVSALYPFEPRGKRS